MLIHSNFLWPLAQQQSFRRQYNREYVFFLQMLTDSLATTFFKPFSVPYHSFRTRLHKEILFWSKSQHHYIQCFWAHGPCIYLSYFHWKLTSTCFPSLDRAYLFSDRERIPPGQNCIAEVVSVCWGVVGKSQRTITSDVSIVGQMISMEMSKLFVCNNKYSLRHLNMA